MEEALQIFKFAVRKFNPENAFDFVAKASNPDSDKACDKNQPGQYYTYGSTDFLSITKSESGFDGCSRMSKALSGFKSTLNQFL